jgi:hypothetical protein
MGRDMDINKKLLRLLALVENGTPEEKEIALVKIEELKTLYGVSHIQEEDPYDRIFLRTLVEGEDGVEDSYINALMIGHYSLKLLSMGSSLYLFGKKGMLTLGRDLYLDLYCEMLVLWNECKSVYKIKDQLAKSSFYSGIITGLKDRLVNTNKVLATLDIVKVELDPEMEANFKKIFNQVSSKASLPPIDMKFFRKGLKDSKRISI